MIVHICMHILRFSILKNKLLKLQKNYQTENLFLIKRGMCYESNKNFASINNHFLMIITDFFFNSC